MKIMNKNQAWTSEGFYRLSVLLSVYTNGGIATIADIKKWLKNGKMNTRNVNSALKFLEYNGLVLKSKDGTILITEKGKKAMHTPMKNVKDVFEKPFIE